MNEKPTIYAFINGGSPGWFEVMAIAEDGEFLAGHISSSVSWAQIDIDHEQKHEHYRRKYPDGFQFLWLDGDKPEDLAIIKQLGEKNRALAEKESASAEQPFVAS